MDGWIFYVVGSVIKPTHVHQGYEQFNGGTELVSSPAKDEKCLAQVG